MRGGCREVARRRFSASESPSRRHGAAGGGRGGGFGCDGAAHGVAVGLHRITFFFTARWKNISARYYHASAGAIYFSVSVLNYRFLPCGCVLARLLETLLLRINQFRILCVCILWPETLHLATGTAIHLKVITEDCQLQPQSVQITCHASKHSNHYV
jgi:hypothetical protein